MYVYLYWISTTLLTAFLLLSAYSYFFSQATINGLIHLGFPRFFRLQLGFLKILAVAVLLIPGIPNYVREWGYAGVGSFLITALVAHLSHRDSPFITVLLVVLFGILCLSNYTMNYVYY